jgi:hypothetical protein
MDENEPVQEPSDGFGSQIPDSLDSQTITAAIVDNINYPGAIWQLPTIYLPKAIGMFSLPFHPVDAYVLNLTPS